MSDELQFGEIGSIDSKAGDWFSRQTEVCRALRVLAVPALEFQAKEMSEKYGQQTGTAS